VCGVPCPKHTPLVEPLLVRMIKQESCFPTEPLCSQFFPQGNHIDLIIVDGGILKLFTFKKYLPQEAVLLIKLLIKIFFNEGFCFLQQ